jgi:endonuclease/exonuclease/phosphatase family metal-dependent hydrolase
MIVLALAGCGSVGLDVLTYNVAGLPEGLSSSEPTRFIPQMAPHLEVYDLVLVQEDFAYHDLLIADLDLPYRSEPAVAVDQAVNDGLNRFAAHPLGELERTRWTDCNGVLDAGSDCLSEKGFSVGTMTVGRRTLHVINHHADAGGGEADQQARAGNFAQLAQVVAAIEGPLVLAGDTNLKPSERDGDATTWQAFLDTTGLVDVCTALDCAEPDHIDRILYRPVDGLDATAWWVDAAFVDPAGEPLSDHPAVAARFTW